MKNKNSKRFPWANNSGLALITVLAVISVLLVAALELARRTGNLALASATDADRVIARETAMSGLHLAMAILAQDGATSEEDSIQEKWAQPEELVSYVAAIGIPPANLTIEIQDELGKLPINALIKKYPGREMNPDIFKVLEQFFLQMTDDPVPLINCIQDWLDHRDDEAVTGISGAESDYYFSLDPPYTCTNGPFTHISELFLVKGITPELFEGDLENETDDLADEETAAIIPADTITVHGIDEDKSGKAFYSFSGKVNINTANETVLRALLPEEKADLAKDLVAYRVEQADDEDTNFTNTLGKGWVDMVIGFSPEEKKTFNALVQYDTDLFRITTKAVANSVETTVHALVQRSKDTTTGKWSCRILQVTKEN